MYFIPPEGELFPEWRIVFLIAYPGPDNFYKIVISFDDIEIIKNSTDWIIIDHHYFNKNMCESFRFDTEITQDGGMSWHSYTPEKASEFLAQELKTELGSHLIAGGDMITGISSMEEVFRKLMSNKPKTGQ